MTTDPKTLSKDVSTSAVIARANRADLVCSAAAAVHMHQDVPALEYLSSALLLPSLFRRCCKTRSAAFACRVEARALPRPSKFNICSASLVIYSSKTEQPEGEGAELVSLPTAGRWELHIL